MASPTPSKQAQKSPEKPIEEPIIKSKKIKKKNYENFSIYLLKILKSIAPKRGISRKSVLIMNRVIHDMLETIATEAGKLAAHSTKNTLSAGEMEAAVDLVMPRELAEYADVEGLKAIETYYRSLNELNLSYNLNRFTP